MTCEYCRAVNDGDEHRCQRCGRRLHPDATRFPVTAGALAPALAAEEAPRPEAPARPQLVTTPPAARSSGHAMYQASLFGPQQVVSQPKSAPKTASPTKPRVRREKPDQGVLNFDETLDGVKTLKTSVEAAIYCNAPVALTAHRVMAAAVDTILGLTGLAVFGITLSLAGVELSGTKQTLPLYGMASFAILLFYRALFAISNGDTPGTRWTGLELLNFDGHRPTRRQRLQRLAGGLISLSAAGLGLAWSLFDEERLAWHDHMSKTFPTPSAAATRRS